MADRLYTLPDIADRLHIAGRDRVRTVRRLFRRFEIPFPQRCRGGLTGRRLLQSVESAYV
jgi:hypothetical protein